MSVLESAIFIEHLAGRIIGLPQSRFSEFLDGFEAESRYVGLSKTDPPWGDNLIDTPT
jgi:hypothetical protein